MRLPNIIFHPLTRLRGPRRQRLIAAFLLLTLLPHSACFHNYSRLRPVEPAQRAGALAPPNVVVLHHGPQTWELGLIQLDEATNTLRGVLSAGALLPTGVTTMPDDTWNRYRTRDKAVALHVAHIYLTGPSPAQLGPVTIPISDIQRVAVVEKATGATVANYVVSTIGTVASAMAILLVIVLLTKSSCPFIYTHDGQQYHLAGELYGGAIYPTLERDDYLRLPDSTLRPVNGEYLLRLTNELHERQFTDVASLWAVDAPTGQRVLPDPTGHLWSVTTGTAPQTARTASGRDARAELLAHDRHVTLFDEAVGSDTTLSTLDLTFARPHGAPDSARLVFTAQNTLWLDYAYGEMTKLFGAAYTGWIKRQAHAPADFHQRWQREQGLPLSVWVRGAAGWRLAGRVPVVGPLASREVVVPVSLAEADPAGATVTVRLTSGFMFWELDRVALDATAQGKLTVHRLTPSSARDHDGRDQTAALATADGHRLAQPTSGQWVELRYAVPVAAAGTTRSFVLHSRGYYEHVRDYHGLPNLRTLRRLRAPGEFSRFSRERYRQFAPRPAAVLATEQLTPILR